MESKKLKPAKQALADAIHQNGGWQGGKYAVYGKQSGRCAFLTCRPQYLTKDHGWFVMLSWIAGEFDMKPFVNWHQCILSRDEYFTAYPEQVKVEVNNETERKVEVEMKSESEVTIKVGGDWHKNGELPPVGEVCEMVDGYGEWRIVEIIALHDGFSHGWDTSKTISYFSDCATEFRPLRTERDKAIDEMIDCLSGRLANCEELAEHLYENGYRKEAK